MLTSETLPKSPSRLAYALILSVCTGALVATFWVGRMPAPTDFGAHVIMTDTWARFHDVPLYQEYFTRRHWMSPNLLASFFVDLLVPPLSALTALRLFMTATFAGTALALYAVTRTYGRSPWLALGALPFVWRGMTAIGLVNYVPCVPLILGGIAIGRWAGREGGWKSALALFALCTTAFFTHGIGFVFVFGMTGLALLLSLRRIRHALVGLAAAPGLAMWLWWFFGSGASRTGTALPDTIGVAKFDGIQKTVTRVADTALNVTRDGIDDSGVKAIAASMLWLLLGSAWIQWRERRSSDHGRPGGQGRACRWGRLSNHALGILALVLVAGVLLLPRWIKGVSISGRLIAPALMLLCLLPRRFAWKPFGAPAVVIFCVVCLGLGAHFARTMYEFDRAEFAAVDELAGHLPPESRAWCVGVRNVRGPFQQRALSSGCKALLRIRTGALAGGGFAHTALNAIEFLPGKKPPFPRNRNRWAKRATVWNAWDYVLVRGRHRPPPDHLYEDVAGVDARGAGGVPWVLYEARRRAAPVAHQSALVGGDGGSPAGWSCPDGMVLSGIEVAHGRLVNGLRPSCRAREEGGMHVKGPVIGRLRGKRHHLRCPGGVAGIHGGAGARIDRLGLSCASGPLAAAGAAAEGRTAVRGGRGGHPFELRCPGHTVAVGLRARQIGALRALGVECHHPTEGGNGSDRVR